MIHPVSFLLGLGAAWALPVLTRTFRPVAVQATAVGMGVFEEARRVLAEQMETLEDIAAEARARREEMLASMNGSSNGGHATDEETDEPAPPRRAASRRNRTERSAQA